jgi:hypothetical protein
MEQNGPWLPVSLQIPQEADFLFEKKTSTQQFQVNFYRDPTGSNSHWLKKKIARMCIPITMVYDL